MCSHDDCEDVYHLRCTGLAALPEGDWYCPPPGCAHARGAVLPAPVPGAAPCAHRWAALPPLRVGARRYRRVLCDGARVYYALTPLARDVTGLAGRALADALRTAAGEPDRVYVRESVFPHDVARLRALRLMNAATHARALVTADALCRAFRACPVPRVQRQLAALRAALAADAFPPEGLPDGEGSEGVAAVVGPVGMKRAREESGEGKQQQQQEEENGSGNSSGGGRGEDNQDNGGEDEDSEEEFNEDEDLDEEMACAPHPVLEDIVLLQQQVAQFRAVVASLESEVTALKKAVSERMAAAAETEAAAVTAVTAAPGGEAEGPQTVMGDDDAAQEAPLGALVAPPALLGMPAAAPSPVPAQTPPPSMLPSLPLGLPAQTTPQLQLQQQQVRWQ